MTTSSSLTTVNRRVKGPAGWIVLGLLAVVLLAIGIGRDGGPRTSQERIDDLARVLACPQCQGESIYESRSISARNARNEITVLVTEGRLTDDEIVAAFATTYGEDIWLNPSSDGSTALVWILPVVAVVLSGVGLVVVFRRWRQEQATSGGDASDDDRSLVAAALATSSDEVRADREAAE